MRAFLFIFFLIQCSFIFSQPGGGGGIGIGGLFDKNLNPIQIDDNRLTIRKFINYRSNKIEYFSCNNNNGKHKRIKFQGLGLHPAIFQFCTDSSINSNNYYEDQILVLIFNSDTMIIEFYGIMKGHPMGANEIMDSIVLMKGIFHTEQYEELHNQFKFRKSITPRNSIGSPLTKSNTEFLHEKKENLINKNKKDDLNNENQINNSKGIRQNNKLNNYFFPFRISDTIYPQTERDSIYHITYMLRDTSKVYSAKNISDTSVKNIKFYPDLKYASFYSDEPVFLLCIKNTRSKEDMRIIFTYDFTKYPSDVLIPFTPGDFIVNDPYPVNPSLINQKKGFCNTSLINYGHPILTDAVSYLINYKSGITNEIGEMDKIGKRRVILHSYWENGSVKSKVIVKKDRSFIRIKYYDNGLKQCTEEGVNYGKVVTNVTGPRIISSRCWDERGNEIIAGKDTESSKPDMKKPKNDSKNEICKNCSDISYSVKLKGTICSNDTTKLFSGKCTGKSSFGNSESEYKYGQLKGQISYYSNGKLRSYFKVKRGKEITIDYDEDGDKSAKTIVDISSSDCKYISWDPFTGKKKKGKCPKIQIYGY